MGAASMASGRRPSTLKMTTRVMSGCAGAVAVGEGRGVSVGRGAELGAGVALGGGGGGEGTAAGGRGRHAPVSKRSRRAMRFMQDGIIRPPGVLLIDI